MKYTTLGKTGLTVSVGPKSVVNGEYEIFDPYVSCTLDTLVMKNATVNGEPVLTPEAAAHQIVFDRIYDAPRPSGRGEIRKFEFSFQEG